MKSSTLEEVAEFRKLNILISHYGIKDGGGYGRTFFLAKELSSLGHNVTLLTSQSKYAAFPFHKEKFNSLTVLSFPDFVTQQLRHAGYGPLNILLKSLYSAFNKFDIVQSDSGHRPSSGIPCVTNRVFHGSKYVSEWWDFFGKGGLYDRLPRWKQLTIGSIDNWAEVHNKKKADAVVALSAFTRKRAIKNGINPDKVIILHGGADVDNIKYIPHASYRSKYGIPKDSLVFCLCGSDDSEILDNEPFLLAMNELKKHINITLFTTGKKISDSLKQKYNLGREFIEFGWIDYKYYSELLSCADIFLLLMKDNTENKARWPNKSGDYFAAGRLILTNPIGELYSITKRFPKSFICVDWNKESLVKSIIAWLNKNENSCLSGKQNRDIAENYLSWQIKAKELAAFYYKILGH